MYGTFFHVDQCITFVTCFTLDEEEPSNQIETITYTIVDTISGVQEVVANVNPFYFRIALMFAICGDSIGQDLFGVPLDTDIYDNAYELAESVMPMNPKLRWIP